MIIFAKSEIRLLLISYAMRKLFRSFFAAIVAIMLAGIVTNCKKDEPVGPNQGNGGGGTQTVAVTGVSLNKTTLSLVEGGSETLTAAVAPSNATNKAVSWKSSDASIASVDNNGKVSAVKAGSATITVTTSDGGKTATCSVTVTSKTINVTGVTIDKTELELVEGESAQLTATVSPENASDKSVKWTSSDEKVATVDNAGKVTAVAPGSAKITVTTTDGNKEASCTITVSAKKIPVEGVTLDKTELELVEGESTQLTASVSPEDASDKSVEWTSSDETVATIDNAGKVTAVAPGTAKITVTTNEGAKEASCTITVSAKKIPVEEVTLDKNEVEIIKGESAQLTATISPEDATDKSVEWSSSDESIATVDETGKVTALMVGTTTIKVKTTDGGKEASCNVTVAPIPVAGVTIEPSIIEIKEGETVQLKASVSPEDADQEVEWTTSDSEIATVDADGLVTAIKPGTVYIAVRSKTDTGKLASCEVTIKPDDSLKGIAFDAAVISLETGQSRTLTVIFTPEYAANKNVTWESSDASVASVSDGNVVALKEGTATITATSEEGEHKAECVVTVSKASGPKVYAKHLGGGFTVNGVSDPMSGAFDSDSFKFDWVSYISAEGNTLYSLENYYSDNGTQMWLCKNRKPIIDVTKYFTNGYDVSDFAARNGIYVILFTKNVNEGLFAVKAKEGEKYIDTYEIPGQGNEFYSPYVALGPNGDIHITTEVKDAFWNFHMGWFKISNSGSFTQKYFDVPRSGYVGVTNAGDVYILTSRDENSGLRGELYKNGVLNKTLEYSDENYYCQLFCSGNDVYTAVIDFPGKKVMIGKNGESYQTVKLDKVSIFSKHSFWVTSNGDTYVCVYGHSDWSDTRIYKNGKLLYKSDSFREICIVEE